MKAAASVCLALAAALSAASPAASQTTSSVYTPFDSEKCRHTPSRAVEDYGSWRCPGHDGITVYLGAADQRMQISFGRNAAREPAASQSFPAFNNLCPAAKPGRSPPSCAGTCGWRTTSATRPDGCWW
jgi:hypothetical protein